MSSARNNNPAGSNASSAGEREEKSVITLESVAGKDIFGKGYSSSHVPSSIMKPWTLFGLGSSVPDSVKFTVQNEYSNNSKKNIENVEIHCSTGYGKDKKEFKIKYLKTDFVSALQNAKILEDGERGVYLTQRVVFNSALANLNPSLLFFSMIFGSGMGDQSVEMVFDQTNRLSKIKVSENYNGESTLFVAKNLRPDAEIKAEKEMKRAQERQVEQKAKEDRKFKF